jgi:hypothetical protein
MQAAVHAVPAVRHNITSECKLLYQQPVTQDMCCTAGAPHKWVGSMAASYPCTAARCPAALDGTGCRGLCLYLTKPSKVFRRLARVVGGETARVLSCNALNVWCRQQDETGSTCVGRSSNVPELQGLLQLPASHASCFGSGAVGRTAGGVTKTDLCCLAGSTPPWCLQSLLKA